MKEGRKYESKKKEIKRLSDLEKKRMERVRCIIFTFGREKKMFESACHISWGKVACSKNPLLKFTLLTLERKTFMLLFKS
jgi:hypothetical protein